MNTLKISKVELVDRIKTNRDNHRKVYEEAIEGYRSTVIGWFNEQVDKAKKNRDYEIMFTMPKPEDHTDDYDNVLDMLNMSIDDIIDITQTEFRQYVRDDWGWKQNFNTTSSYYISN